MLLRRPTTLEEVRGRIRVEHGSLDGLSGVRKLAICAHFSTSPAVSLSFRTLVRQLAECGYRPLVVSATEGSQPLDWSGARHPDAIVVRKPNIGYDFGSWSVGIALSSDAAPAADVLLVNDSMVGPFASIAPLVERFERSPVDVWSLTDTYQVLHHLQSFFLGFRAGVLSEPPLHRFWTNVRQEKDKWRVINRYELALTRLAKREGFTCDSAFHSDEVTRRGLNPMISAWWVLLDAGLPMIKRQIVTQPEVAPRADRVAAVLWDRFGVRLADWL